MTLNELQQHFSFERVSSYVGLAQKRGLPSDKAVDLYKINILLCEELYSLISCIEICLRNKIHDKMRIAFGRNDWFNSPRVTWREKHMADLETAVCDISRRKHLAMDAIRPDQIVCALNFGFWCHLFDDVYENQLWTQGLNRIFPHYNGKPNRKHIAHALVNLLRVRNRIAHFEIIIKDENKLLADYNKMTEIINWFSPEIYLWFKSFNNFETLYFKLHNNSF